MSQPWMKFYPSDWRADPALRMCSLSARGLWMEMLCIMHEAGGYLMVNDKQLLPRQLAVLAGAAVDDVNAWLLELSDAGVFSRNADGTIYSRRILKDIARAEGDKANGRKGGNPALKGGVNPPVGGGDKAQKPDTRYQIPESERQTEDAGKPAGEIVQFSAKQSRKQKAGRAPDYSGDFELWWAEYPRTKAVSKSDAFNSFDRLITEDQDAAIEGAIAYASLCRTDGTPERFICHPAVFLNQRRWETLGPVREAAR